MTGHGEKRSRKWELLIAALLTHPSVEAAAKETGISPVSAWRWMRDPIFAEAYRAARREVMRQTTARLQEASREAVECLRQVQRNGESESARVAAARTILEHAIKAVDLDEITERVEALERAERGVSR